MILHSTFINEERAIEVLEWMRPAIQRGAVIDILWGQSREKNNVNETRRAALALKARLVAEGVEDRVRVHMITATRSHCKVVLADQGEANGFQALARLLAIG